jgi:putative ABC transport system substrate-binding protein
MPPVLTVALAMSLLAAPLTAGAQGAGKVYRVGLLTPGAPTSSTVPVLGVLGEELRGLGWAVGRNVVMERRDAGGSLERLPGMAAELARLPVDVIIAVSPQAIEAARDATRTIPIVMAFADDPVARGFVASLGRPGGNITGLALEAGDLNAKRLELLKETLPGVTRIAFLAWTASPHTAGVVAKLQEAARPLGIRLQVVGVQDAALYDAAFTAMARERAGGLFVQSNPVFFRDHRRIIALAATHRLPTLCEWREMAEAGCLMSYGASLSALFRRAATFVDKILTGARPADLPVEQPTTFELVVNLKTARDLRLTMPPSVLVRADEVIR